MRPPSACRTRGSTTSGARQSEILSTPRVPELTAMKISGHRSRETFRRYAIEDPSELAAAIERVAEVCDPSDEAASQGRAVLETWP